MRKGTGIVLGARVPIVLTSRADTADTRVASTAIALAMAHAKGNVAQAAKALGISRATLYRKLARKTSH